MVSLISCSFLINKSSRRQIERQPRNVYLYRSREYWHFKLYFHAAPRFELHAPRRDTHTLTPVHFPSTLVRLFRGLRLTHHFSQHCIYESSRRRILETSVRVEGELVIDRNGKLFCVSNCLQNDAKLRYCKERVNLIESDIILCIDYAESLIERKCFFLFSICRIYKSDCESSLSI